MTHGLCMRDIRFRHSKRILTRRISSTFAVLLLNAKWSSHSAAYMRAKRRANADRKGFESILHLSHDEIKILKFGGGASFSFGFQYVKIAHNIIVD